MNSIKSTKLYRHAHAVADSMVAWAPDAFYAYKGRTIERFILFAGYARSGSSLIGALLNAHPEMMVSHEAHILHHLKYSKGGMGGIVRLIFNKEREICKKTCSYSKQLVFNYVYGVKNQWQGKYSRLRVIGDKEAQRTGEALYESPGLFDSLRSRMKVPLCILFTCRNPYDIVATQYLRKSRQRGAPIPRVLSEFKPADAEKPELDQKSVSDFLEISSKSTKVFSSLSPDKIFLIKNEDFIASPKDKLREICAFVGVECTEDYLTDCAAIVYPSPHQTRFKVKWTPGQIEEVAAAVKKHPWFEGYTFDA